VIEAAVDEPATSPPSLLANSRWNLVAFACALAPSFITVPLVVRLIGLPAFGRAGLVLAVCAPLILVGTVLGQAIVREVSSRVAAGDAKGARRSVDAALRLCFVGSSVGWLLLIAFGPWLTQNILAEASAASELELAFLIAATGFFVQQFTLVLQATSAARQDFRTIAAVAAFSAAATIGSIVGLTLALPAVEGYLSGVTVGLTLSCLVWVWVSRAEVRLQNIVGADLTLEARALLRFARWQSVTLLVGAFSNQIDRYTLGAVAPANLIGQYNVANRLQEAAYIGAVRSGEVLFPRFGSLADRSVEERGELFQRASWLVGTFSAMMLAPLVPLSDAVINLWVPQAGHGAAVLLRTLVLGGVIGCGSNVFSYHAMGIGRNAQVAFITVLYSIVAIAFTVILISTFGPFAAGGGLLVASVVRLAAALVQTKRDFFPFLSWADLSTSTVVPLAAGTFVAIVTDVAGAGEVRSWFHLVAIYVALSISVLILTLTLTSLTDNGRRVVSALLRALRSQTPVSRTHS
jgi:O-antigen/teichoic acid export membrane protein